jgi:glycosyltransferase involved in cell wall biosynthesis
MARGLILIPVFNEEENIGKVLEDIKALKLDIDLLIINDGSKDNTLKIVKTFEVEVISHIINLNYGSALQTGFKYAVIKDYDYVLQFDGDGQHDPKDIYPMIKEIEKDNADIVIGSRFLGKGNFKVGFLKKIVISFMVFLINIFTACKITDPTSGLKALSKRTFSYFSKSGNFPSDYPDADIIIRMLRKKYRIVEIPINVRKRNYGTSMHSGLKPIIYIFKVLLSIFITLLREIFVKE